MNDGLRSDRHLLLVAERRHEQQGRRVQRRSQHHEFVHGDGLPAGLDVGHDRPIDCRRSELGAAGGQALSAEALTLP